MKNIFNKEVSEEVIGRIEKLNSSTPNLWGKMNVSQMLAHCNVAYDMTYTEKYPKPKGFKKFIIKLFAKNLVFEQNLIKKT